MKRAPVLILPFDISDTIYSYSLQSNDEHGKEKEKISKTSRESCLYYDILTMMDEVFLPALSLSEGNCCLAEEIWSILRVYPYHCRYR